MGDEAAFAGAKLALFLGEDLAVILRDEKPGLPFAGYWDLPGGGREGAETPLECALRECHEELGLTVPSASVTWRRAFREEGQIKWFFAAHLPAEAAGRVVFGDEGQSWDLMDVDTFLSHPKAVPQFQQRLRSYLKERKPPP